MNIIIGNNLKKIKKLINSKNIKSIYLAIDLYNKETKAILDYIQKEKIETRQLFNEDITRNFGSEYASLIGKLNYRNHSLDWWAFNFTNKNPITSRLLESVYYSALIDSAIKKYSDENKCLIVISSDYDLHKQVQFNVKNNNKIYLFNAIKKYSIKRKINSLIPASLIFVFLKTLTEAVYSKLKLSVKSEIDIKPNLVVIMSLLYGPSFNNNSYQDLYFGYFVDYIKKMNVNFISFMQVCDNFGKMIKQSQKLGRDYNIYPKEYFVSFKSIFTVFLKSLINYFRKPFNFTNITIYGTDVSLLINKYIHYETISTAFYSNTLIYYSVKNLAENCKIKALYYPFENRSFEKMIILSLRKFSPETKIIGYQHASLSLRHTNFLLEEKEKEILPLPDLIITMGEETKRIMQNVGGFPAKKLVSGSALRQKTYKGELKNRNKSINNIFVALATGFDEYVKAIKYLNVAFGNRSDRKYQIWIRPHPVFQLEKAFEIGEIPRFAYYKADKENLEDCYKWADAICYVHSTISIEGLMRGIPAISLQFNDILNPDPLFGFQDFKWEVNDPEKFDLTIRKIEQLSETEFHNKQKQGNEYAKKYIIDADDKKMEEMLLCS